MAASVVQSKLARTSSAVTSVSVALDTAVTAGSTLVALIGSYNTGAFGTTAVTDTRSNTWTRHASRTNGSLAIAIFSAPTVAGGTTTLTVTCATTGVPVVAVYEVSGLSGFDSSATNSGSSATHATGTTASVAQPTVFLMALSTHTGGTSAPTAASGWTLGVSETDNNTYQALGTAYKADSSASGGQSTTFTWENTDYDAAIAVFTVAGGGGGGAATSSDTGTGMDGASGTRNSTPADTGSGVDGASGTRNSTPADTGTGVDGASGTRNSTPADTGTGVEQPAAAFVTVSSDTAIAAESLSGIAVSLGDDTASGTDTVSTAYAFILGEALRHFTMRRNARLPLVLASTVPRVAIRSVTAQRPTIAHIEE